MLELLGVGIHFLLRLSIQCSCVMHSDSYAGSQYFDNVSILPTTLPIVS